MWIYGGPASIRNSTIAFNTAHNVGGVLCQSHDIELLSTIIAKNTADAGIAADFGVPVNSGIVTGGDHDLVMSYSAGSVPAGTTSVDPLLKPLADNGGYTLSHALEPTSPAIDNGIDTSSLTVDQRDDATHYPRTVGAAPDIGAYELNPDIIFFDGLQTKHFRLF
jgi:hypothetical protein